MSERHRALVIGLGQIGMGYDLKLDPTTHVYTHAQAFSAHEAFELAGGVDPDPARRQEFEKKFGARAFEDAKTALTASKPDVVAVAGPTAAHGSLVTEILEHAKPKAILCEKPLSHELHEAEDLVARCERRGVKLFVNYMRRADPGVVEIERRIHGGLIATPVKGICWYSKGFLHNGSHFFNLLERWLGPMGRFSIIDKGRTWNGEEPEPDVRVQFRDGVIDFIAAREEDFSHYTVELISSTGRMRYEEGGRLIEWQGVVSDPFIPGYRVLDVKPERVPSGRDRSQWHIAEQLAAALAERTFHLCTGAEALVTLKSMTSINNAR